MQIKIIKVLKIIKLVPVRVGNSKEFISNGKTGLNVICIPEALIQTFHTCILTTQ